MRAVIQRVKCASVVVQDQVHGQEPEPEPKPVSSIGPGLLTLLGIAVGDTPERLEKLIRKITALRIFADDAGKLNRSLIDIKGEHLIVSQFTLLADTAKGNRPSFLAAAPAQEALLLYERSIEISRGLGLRTSGGRFQADMLVSLENDGPITIVLEG